MTQMELEARSQIAMQEIERRLSEYDALTQERDELREALAEAVELIERECGDPDPDSTLAGVNRINPLKFYDISRMRALATKKET